MISPKFRAKNIDGKLKIEEKDSFDMYLSALPEEVFVSVTKKGQIRSSNQSKYYWGVVIPLISESTGYTKDETHEWLKENILAIEVIPDKCRRISIAGREIKFVPSTTQITTEEFENFMSKTREWASMELSCYIPLPNEVE